MLLITRILHANDFSPAAKTALKYSMRLARSLRAPLDVLRENMGMKLVCEKVGFHPGPSDDPTDPAMKVVREL